MHDKEIIDRPAGANGFLQPRTRCSIQRQIMQDWQFGEGGGDAFNSAVFEFDEKRLQEMNDDALGVEVLWIDSCVKLPVHIVAASLSLQTY